MDPNSGRFYREPTEEEKSALKRLFHEASQPRVRPESKYERNFERESQMTKPLTMSEDFESALRNWTAKESTSSAATVAQLLRELDATRERLAQVEQGLSRAKKFAETITNAVLNYELSPQQTPPPPPAPEPPSQLMNKEPLYSYDPEACVNTAKPPPTQPAGEFGEPWNCKDPYSVWRLFDNAGNLLANFGYDSKQAHRAATCVNALSGIPDPEAFVRAAKDAIPRTFATDTKVISGREWAAIEKVIEAAIAVKHGNMQPKDCYLCRLKIAVEALTTLREGRKA